METDRMTGINKFWNRHEKNPMGAFTFKRRLSRHSFETFLILDYKSFIYQKE